MLRLMKALLAFLPVFTAMAQGPLRPIALLQHGAATAAAILFLLLPVEVALWRIYHRWQTRALRPLLVATATGWGLAMPTVAIVGFAAKPHLLSVLGMGLVFLAFLGAWRRFERRLHRASSAEKASTHDDCKCPISVLPPDEQNRKHRIVIEVSDQIAKCSTALPRARTTITSALAVWLASGVLAVFGVTLALAGTSKVVDALQSESSQSPPTKPVSTSTNPPPSTGTATKTSPAAPAPSSPGTTAWTGTCTGSPSNSAPEEDEDEISELYTGEPPTGTSSARFPLPTRTGAPPGRRYGGCTREFHEAATSVGLFVWAWGQNPISGRILSIAVDSEHYGPALFLAPAVEPVETLIKRFHAIGGIRRFEAGTGDFYPVETPVGTFILIRREKGTELNAVGYHVVPPVIGQAWAEAMRKANKFLWPVRVRHEDGYIYDFDSNTTPSRVIYTAPDNTSEAGEPELGEPELQQDANRAR